MLLLSSIAFLVHEVNMEFTKIPLDKKNRMVRLGFGKHDDRWFVRVDLWTVGFRLAQL